jgi:hypothetical protein
MSDELERLRLENAALREMVEEREQDIHDEYGAAGEREPFDWLPEIEQVICKMTTGHTPVTGETEISEMYRSTPTSCSSCGAFIDRVWERIK